MNRDKIQHFLDNMSAYDGFSDINHPNVRVWDLDFNEKTYNDFSNLCLFNANDSISARFDDVDDVLDFIPSFKDKFNHLNSDMYPLYTKGDFDFQSRLVGFLSCFLFTNLYSFLPIIELSGPDAQSIVNSIILSS